MRRKKMAEPFAKPTKEQAEKLVPFINDPIGYWATNMTIRMLNEMKGKDLTPNYWRDFYRSARLMILNYGALATFDLVHLAVQDLADDKKFKWLGKDLIISKEKKKIKLKFKSLEGTKTISDIAYIYGVEKGKGKNWVCPFHEDKDPSLSLDDEKNIFHCFGCNSSGDGIEFIRKLEGVKEIEKNRSKKDI